MRLDSAFSGRLAGLALFGALCVPLAPAGSQHALVSLPLSDAAYVQLEALDRQGCAAARVSPYRPYLVGAIREALEKARQDPWCAGRILLALDQRFALDSAPQDSLYSDDGWVRTTQPANEEGLRVGGAVTVRATGLGNGEFRPMWADVRGTEEGSPPAVGILRGRVTWSGGKQVVAVAEAYGQTHRRNDPKIRGRAFRNTSGVLDFDEAYIAGKVGRLVLSFGRAPEAWLGEGEESLMLSAHAPPMDRLSASVVWRQLEGRALYGTLSNVVLTEELDDLEPGTPSQALHRIFVGHALTWRPRSSVELTVGETAQLSRGGTIIDLAYANPLMPYVVTQNDSARATDRRDNLGAFGAARLRFGAITLSGELFVDDIQIDAADRARIPDQLAWWIKSTAALPLIAPASIGIEYKRIDAFTYRRRPYAEVYQQFDRPLGSELGPDADIIRGSAEVWPAERLRLSGSAGYWRRGAVRIAERPGRSAEEGGVGPFPSVTDDRPVNQRAMLGDLTAQFLSVRLPVTLRLEAARVSNTNNQPAAAEFLMRAHLSATYALRYP